MGSQILIVWKNSIYESNVEEIDEMAHDILEGELLAYDLVNDCCFLEHRSGNVS